MSNQHPNSPVIDRVHDDPLIDNGEEYVHVDDDDSDNDGGIDFIQRRLHGIDREDPGSKGNNVEGLGVASTKMRLVLSTRMMSHEMHVNCCQLKYMIMTIIIPMLEIILTKTRFWRVGN